jgi:hypothetical protein
MKVIFENEENKKQVKVGDILVMGMTRISYMIIKRRDDNLTGYNKVYDIVGLDNPGTYWTGGLTWEEVIKEAAAAKAIYSIDEYEMVIRKK